MENSKTTLLVVDDDPGHMRTTVEVFKGLYQVLFAIDGLEGYEVACEEKPDIIIMDWEMPVMNGLETTAKLKANPDTKDIPILIATGIMTTSVNLKEALEVGAVDFIRKPFEPLELISRTQAALRLSQSMREIKALRKREQESFQKELARKDRELTLQALQVQEKGRFLGEITAEIERLETRLDGLEEQLLGNIKKRMLRHVDADGAWDNFLLHFESVHPSFFNGLKKEVSDLTANEIRLCAYLKLGMGNKEMAQVGGVNPDTVKRNLNRMKKKFDLNAADSLREYLMSYTGS